MNKMNVEVAMLFLLLGLVLAAMIGSVSEFLLATVMPAEWAKFCSLLLAFWALSFCALREQEGEYKRSQLFPPYHFVKMHANEQKITILLLFVFLMFTLIWGFV